MTKCFRHCALALSPSPLRGFSIHAIQITRDLQDETIEDINLISMKQYK
ncbi:hypothetical protein SynSYN20_03188 [Synechococcus sp. SYN20]|nr:hypothetical protein SynSYN20_03188 [Synechococcus sp. SYN20]